MSWSRNDLSQYNRASAPWFEVHMNGKVDIGKEPEDNDKISLERHGMFKLVEKWFSESGHMLLLEEKQKLNELLNK